ncbi:MAG TPA: hypothetical protein VLL98_05390 [Rickettsiales bacterium]|nr:hypothetical protein [Rickettsiales bacterium]
MKKIFILIFLLFSQFAFAETEEDYIIDNLKVNRSDKDATTAREKAITKGQRDAFNIILARLSIDDTNSMAISDEEISQMLRSLQIKNEKITDNSYSATLTLEFSPDYVKYILNKYKITKFSPVFDSYLIIPVLKEDGNTYVWERNNRWTNFFNKNVKENNNIFLIENDFASKNLVDTASLNKPIFSKFRNLAELYNVNNIVVVIGNYNKITNVIDTKIYVLSNRRSRNAALNYEMQNPNNPNLDFNDASIKIIEYLNGLASLDLENNEYSYSSQNQREGTYIFVKISSIKDYNNINKILRNNKNITSANLKSIEKKLAIYFVKYKDNDLQSLISSLEADGFSVSEKRNGLFIFI